ncbi:hypothetical protein G4B88_027865 [Cannabis sativa]|uniref:Transposase Tnp1/En/Spm-like domain-containing protein n=1 Tax=Cannabis sativa TaxID=3483 RepID=A0A7J6I691_CANSA|nr:hypothetical protein G4B88_027865 [Cannabis sativa]
MELTSKRSSVAALSKNQFISLMELPNHLNAMRMDDELLQTGTYIYDFSITTCMLKSIRKSAKNKSSHAKNKYNHTTGRKNFAQLRALQKAGGASTPTRATMFKICYAKKKKSIINEKTKEVMLQLQEREEKNEDSSKEKTMNDSFFEIMGGQRYGSICMFRFGVCPFNTLDRGDIATSSNLFSSSAYDTLVIELASTSFVEAYQQKVISSYRLQVGETVNIKNVTNEPKTIAIGIVCSKDPSKKVGGEELRSFFFPEVIVKVPIKPNELLIKLYGCIKTIHDAVGGSIAWPATFMVIIVKVPIKPNELLIKLYGCIKTIHDAVGGSIAWPTTFMISCKSDTQLDDSMLSFNYYKIGIYFNLLDPILFLLSASLCWLLGSFLLLSPPPLLAFLASHLAVLSFCIRLSHNSASRAFSSTSAYVVALTPDIAMSRLIRESSPSVKR